MAEFMAGSGHHPARGGARLSRPLTPLRPDQCHARLGIAPWSGLPPHELAPPWGAGRVQAGGLASAGDPRARQPGPCRAFCSGTRQREAGARGSVRAHRSSIPGPDRRRLRLCGAGRVDPGATTAGRCPVWPARGDGGSDPRSVLTARRRGPIANVEWLDPVAAGRTLPEDASLTATRLDEPRRRPFLPPRSAPRA